MNKSAEHVLQRRTVVRRRGRPAGINRVPLTLDERRARNAEYERQRRQDRADAMGDLAAAVGVANNLTAAELLARTVCFLQTSMQADCYWDATTLRRCNDNLASQIDMLEHRLATEPELKPLKRELEDSDWQCPPSKRFSAGPFQEPSYWSEDRHRMEHSLCRASVSPLSYFDGQLSPGVSYPESSTPDSGVSSSSVSGCCFSDVKTEDLAELASVFSDALDACGPLTLSQLELDIWATEEDLASMYF